MARPAKPWFRSAEDCWFATVNGKKVNLFVRGRKNEAAAWREFERVRAGGSPVPTQPPVPVTPQAPAQPPKAVTVVEVIRAFLTDAEGRVEPETLEVYRLFLNNFGKRHGHLPAADLSAPTVEAYSRRPNWSVSTRSAFLAVVLRAYRHGVRSRLIPSSPLADLKRPSIKSRAADVLVTEEQHEKLCAVAPAAFRVFLQFLWLTGCRPGEAAKLSAIEVDTESGVATPRKHKTEKAGKRRTLYLPPAALDLIRPLLDRYPTGPLFRNRIGNGWRRATLGAAMRKASQKAGLPRKILYGLRHTFATDALAAGVPDAQVAELLGHSSTAMLHRHYSHLGTKRKVMAEALKRVR